MNTYWLLIRCLDQIVNHILPRRERLDRRRVLELAIELQAIGLAVVRRQLSPGHGELSVHQAAEIVNFGVRGQAQDSSATHAPPTLPRAAARL